MYRAVRESAAGRRPGNARDVAASLFLSLGFATLSTPDARAVTLQFDYSFDSSGFFAIPERRNVLEAAGGYFSSLLTDTLTAITPGGVNQFTATLFDPSSLQTLNLPDFAVTADTVVVFVGASAALGGSLGFGGPGGFSVGGTQAFVDNVFSRGQGSDAFSPGAIETAPWGGSLSFSATAAWYFDPDVSTTEPFSGNDFYSVALHELGHLLGLGTATAWSTFVAGGLFVGANAVAAQGGPIAVSGAHWADGTVSNVNGVPQEAAMDPTLTVGTRKRFTALDVAALDDIGWDIAPPPEAPTQVPAVPAVATLIGMLFCLASARLAHRVRTTSDLRP